MLTEHTCDSAVFKVLLNIITHWINTIEIQKLNINKNSTQILIKRVRESMAYPISYIVYEISRENFEN